MLKYCGCWGKKVHCSRHVTTFLKVRHLYKPLFQGLVRIMVFLAVALPGEKLLSTSRCERSKRTLLFYEPRSRENTENVKQKL
jgi:hypothetical protein